MKRRGFFFTIITCLSLWVAPRALAGCSGQLTCERWDQVLGVCTTSGQTRIDCVESGGSCQWGGDCDKCSAHGGDCTGTADGTTPSPPPGGGGASCFPAGTRVMMENGEERSIENVRVGDRVVSQSESGERAVSQVSAIETPMRDHMCTVTFADGGRLRLTDEHPLYTQDGWKSIVPAHTAKENVALRVKPLTSSDKVKRADGTMAEISNISCYSQKMQTYNLILEDGYHTYFADNYLAHNKGGSCTVGNPTAPVNVAPPNGSTQNPQDVTFSWYPAPDFDSADCSDIAVYYLKFKKTTDAAYTTYGPIAQPVVTSVSVSNGYVVVKGSGFGPVGGTAPVRLDYKRSTVNTFPNVAITTQAGDTAGFYISSGSISGYATDGSMDVTAISNVDSTRYVSRPGYPIIPLRLWPDSAIYAWSNSGPVPRVGETARVNIYTYQAQTYTGLHTISKSGVDDVVMIPTSSLPNLAANKTIGARIGGRYVLSSTLAAGTYTWHVDSNNGVNSASSAEWTFNVNAGCTVTPPTALSVSGDTLTWSPGNKGLQQLLRVGSLQGEVLAGCPVGSSCVANPSLPATSYVPPSSPFAAQRLWYYRKSTGTCAQTASTYTDMTSCETNIETYVKDGSGNPDTTGVCYPTQLSCENYNVDTYTVSGLDPGTTYYWRVVNFHDASCYASAITSQQVPGVSGTVWLDANGDGSSVVPFNIGGLTATLRGTAYSATVDPSNGEYVIAAPSGTYANLDLSGIPSTYSCSPYNPDGCPTITNVTSYSGANDFYLTSSHVGWWQVVGGPIYAGSTAGGTTVRSTLPTAASRLILPGAGGGTVAALLKASGTTSLGTGQVSDTGWMATTKYKGKTLNYDFYATQYGITSTTPTTWGGNGMNQLASGQDYYYERPSGGSDATVGGWTVNNGDSYVVFVNGNLTITGNMSVAQGGFLALIVNGNVTVDPAVTQLDGIVITDGSYTTNSTGTGDSQLLANGSTIAWGGVSLGRDLGGANVSTPAEKFTYRPDLLTNMPDKMKTFAMTWEEVVPGTIGN